MGRRRNSASSKPALRYGDGQSLIRASCDNRLAGEERLLDQLPKRVSVPDGDTGSNMFLTMQAAVKAVASSPDHDASAVARAVAHGALMGARGNSGVILSQMLRGFAQGMDKKETIDCVTLATALAQASVVAYKGVSKPVEGTMLTVIREVAEAAQAAAPQAADLGSLLETVSNSAKASVARTPTLLKVLQDAGVVDAGGQGLYVILDGILRYPRGELNETTAVDLTAAGVPASAAASQDTGPEYGYCTEFLVQGQDLNIDSIRQKIVSLGDSALVVGDGDLVRVHVHTFDPGSALSYATSIGILRQVKVENMQIQHQDFLSSVDVERRPIVDGVSTVVVASGTGLSEVFHSLGASAIVPGGQTMNPSTEELLAAVESVPTNEVILLPNNSNIIFSAGQVPGLTKKTVRVIPTETIPQGITSLMAFNPTAGLDDNSDAMEKARTVRTIEITKAVRTANVNGLRVSEGQVIGLLEGNLVMADEDFSPVIDHLLSKAAAAQSELITIYAGKDVEASQAAQIVEFVRSKYPAQQVEVVDGGQPHYHFIISVE